MDIVVGGLEVGVWIAIIGGAIGAIFILRAVVCWYLRLSLIASLLVQIRDRLPEKEVPNDHLIPEMVLNRHPVTSDSLPTENGSPGGGRYPRKDGGGT